MYYEILYTAVYEEWFEKLKDRTAKTRILVRLARIENGNFGTIKQLTSNLFELKLVYGSGYRIYYTIQDNIVVLLINGGDKSSQQKDIKKAKELLKEI
ncbi:MAG: addiction module antitoxin RelB [Desulfobacteraceae bacterium 4572_130]|nr:MAG: addiction module antitoxin RelB [Desulfobacteraceae bacterium 4572_130]